MNPMMMMPNLNRIAILPKPEMPAAIQILFAARPPLSQIKPAPKNKCRPYDPLINSYINYIDKFEEGDPPERIVEETPRQRRERLAREKVEAKKQENKELAKSYNPKEDLKVDTDPLKTLFVGRLNYETDEKKLRKEFEIYGPIKDIKIVRDVKTNKSRGYAFIEYENKRAYKQADGKKIDGRRVLVDFERGRTVEGWLPRRLGGGKGETRKKKEPEREREDRRRDGSRSASPKRRDEKPKFGRDAYLEKFKRGTEGGGFDRERRDNRGGRDRSFRDRGDRGDRGGERSERGSDRYGGNRDRYGGDRDRSGADRDRFGGDRDRGDRDNKYGDRDRYGGSRRDDRDRDRNERKPYREERTEERERDREKDRDRKTREKRSRSRSRSYSKEKERRHEKEERRRKNSIEAGQIVNEDDKSDTERKKKKKKDKEKKEKKEKKSKHKKKDKKKDRDDSSDEEGERDSAGRD